MWRTVTDAVDKTRWGSFRVQGRCWAEQSQEGGQAWKLLLVGDCGNGVRGLRRGEVRGVP